MWGFRTTWAPISHGFRIDGIRRSARGVELDPVVKNKQPDRPLHGVVPVSDRIDNRFPQSGFRQFRPGLRFQPSNLVRIAR